jgi:lysylphosphatidylglycerol synthetase-like protein (DUF2156 family)
MDKRQLLGYGGAGLLLIGFFSPLFTISLMGFSRNFGFVDFLSEGSWASILVLVAVALAAVLTILKKYKLLLIPAGLVVAMLVYLVANLAGNLASSGIDSAMAETLIKMLQPSFGWLFLVLGPVALVLSGFMKPAPLATPAEPAV